MKHCCENKTEEINILREKQYKVLKIVFLINFFMFFVEFINGLKAQSSALMGDSLDMLGDSFVYGFSLYVLNKSHLLRIRAAQMKGIIMLLFGLFVMSQIIYKIITMDVPRYETMSLIGALALVANIVCLIILYSHREDDINMRSTWLCSRNDIIANCGTILAAVLVAYLNSAWPDIIIGAIIANLFLSTSYGVLKDSFSASKENSCK